jgi:predicted amidohydrolase YtcJ
MKSIYKIACVVAVALLIGCDQQPVDEAADTVYTNGRIYTVNQAQLWAEAVAIKDGKFIAVGSSVDINAMAGNGTKLIDLNGRFVMPGLHDIHLHIQNAYTADALKGELLFIPSGITSVDELEKVLRRYVDANPDAELLFAENLPYTLFPDNHPKKEFLDAIVEDRPFYILSETQHEGLMNSKALEAEGITADTPDPELGEIMKDPETGEPTGFLKEEATKPVWSHYPIPAPEEVEQGLKATLVYGNSVGLTSVMQVHAKPDVANGVKGLDDKGELTMRFEASNDPVGEAAIESSFDVDLDFGSEGGGTQHGRWHAFCTCSKSHGWVGNTPPFGRISSFVASTPQLRVAQQLPLAAEASAGVE